MTRSSTSGQRQLEMLQWPQLQRAAAQSGSTVVWPFGAFEQHGPQLPLGTDALFADRLFDQVLAALPTALPIWRLPVQSLGFSPEHQSFPGTLSLPSELLIAQITCIGAQLADAGFQRLVLFNAHGGQIALLQVAARQLRASRPELAVLPCFLWSGPKEIGELLPEPERSQGLHAGLAETSLMLQLAPELVGPERPIDGVLPEPPRRLELGRCRTGGVAHGGPLQQRGCGRQPRRQPGARCGAGAASGGGMVRPVHRLAGQLLATGAGKPTLIGRIADAQKLSEPLTKPQEMVTVDSIALCTR